MKIIEVQNSPGEYHFNCPGCKMVHKVYLTKRPDEPVWSWNGSVDKPTISPSILVRWNYAEKKFVCHSFIRDGNIQFLDDCTHSLKGQTVEIPEWGT